MLLGKYRVSPTTRSSREAESKAGLTWPPMMSRMRRDRSSCKVDESHLPELPQRPSAEITPSMFGHTIGAKLL